MNVQCLKSSYIAKSFNNYAVCLFCLVLALKMFSRNNPNVPIYSVMNDEEVKVIKKWCIQLEKEMVTYSSTLALKIPWTEEPMY